MNPLKEFGSLILLYIIKKEATTIKIPIQKQHVTYSSLEAETSQTIYQATQINMLRSVLVKL